MALMGSSGAEPSFTVGLPASTESSASAGWVEAGTAEAARPGLGNARRNDPATSARAAAPRRRDRLRAPIRREAGYMVARPVNMDLTEKVRRRYRSSSLEHMFEPPSGSGW